jgi:hypothetical protein
VTDRQRSEWGVTGPTMRLLVGPRAGGRRAPSCQVLLPHELSLAFRPHGPLDSDELRGLLPRPVALRAPDDPPSIPSRRSFAVSPARCPQGLGPPSGRRRTAGVPDSPDVTVFLLTLDNKYALEVVIVLLAAFGASFRGVNCAICCAGIAVAVLIALDLSHPINFTSEIDRVLFTLAGVGLAIVVFALANPPNKRTARTAS